VTPDKALELVGRYARLTKAIKLAGVEIGKHLEQCKGVSGLRGTEFTDWNHPALKTDSKNRELDLHLVQWYTPEREEYGWTYPDIDEDECAHCYAAHLAVGKRKELRRELGNVKRVMTRSAA
jgi:hypothetical protein